MANGAIGTAKEIDPEAIWRSEREYVGWLVENLDQLGDVLEMEFFDVQHEAKVAGHVVDIVAHADGLGQAVIECKLGRATLDHLGQLLAYAGAYGARVLILVAPFLGDDIRAAAHWLNDAVRADVEVWAIEFQVVQIGDSDPAPHFAPVIRPNRFYELEPVD